MERRWPLGLALLLLLCAPLTPGARAKEGIDPGPRCHPSPGCAGTLLPEPAFRRRPLSCASSLFLLAPLSSAPVSPGRQAILWPGQPLVFDPKQLLSPVGHQLAPAGLHFEPGVGTELLIAAR